MKIRVATMDDIHELTTLMFHLGYPTKTENMIKRFTHIKANPDYHTLLASYDNKMVGMVGLVKGHYYEWDGIYVRIVALVVHTDYRNKGIGNKLLEEAESWAKNIGAIGIILNSGKRPERTNAHKFYTSRGYVERSIGFAKSLI
ncbi:GNAT family N-acetyltransferase [Bacillus sp. FJAT-50079]|uniref:GNAT family N-acetyltransferase n=1 Tax=Bacillus sp. FJAT-50079 TaxID=2833577 RepID=UPI001BCA3872|nr:GNAT family N-acetyltransferase [Bacillus sp. FJAT-50079]MBS4210508.1 GNAT family N-acetyltransferase [Bacillus sp. FJAT-50079]